MLGQVVERSRPAGSGRDIGVPQGADAKRARNRALARHLAQRSKATATLRAYESDWRQFDAFCDEHGMQSLPATGETLREFMAHQAHKGRTISTIRRRILAIGQIHAAVGEPRPDQEPRVREVLAGISRMAHAAARAKAPALAEDVMAMVDCVGDGRKQKMRDRALLLFGFAGAFRRSELVAVEVGHVRFVDEGARVLIPRSKTDQHAKGQTVAIIKEVGSDYCPVTALQDWLTVSEIGSGAVFRRMFKNDTVGKDGLSPQSVALLIKKYAELAGLQAASYAGHSLRRGFLTSAAQNDRSVFKMAQQSRHKTLDMVQRYVEDERVFEDHAGEGLLRRD